MYHIYVLGNCNKMKMFEFRKDDLQWYFFQDICFSTVLPFILVYVSLIYKIHDLVEIVPLSLFLSCNLLLESFIGFSWCVKYLYTYCQELQEYIIQYLLIIWQQHIKCAKFYYMINYWNGKSWNSLMDDLFFYSDYWLPHVVIYFMD